jgi:hypothetical protein
VGTGCADVGHWFLDRTVTGSVDCSGLAGMVPAPLVAPPDSTLAHWCVVGVTNFPFVLPKDKIHQVRCIELSCHFQQERS